MATQSSILSCLENPMDGGDWWATAHRVAKSRTRFSDYITIQVVYYCTFQSTVRLKNVLFFVFSLCIIYVKSIIDLSPYSSI